ncbi:MAG: prepilin peptidase, partial [Deltaproteobacteria bacterium]|nr:prepilin peptidase [Deltaproteobacteria bacterium]
MNIFFHWSLVLAFGLILGSFFALVVVRLPAGESVVKPRSFCRSCGKTIAWWQNIPVFSFLFLKGRCAFCQAKLSCFYPLIELTTGLILVLSFFRLKPEWRFLLWALSFVAPLTLLFFMDLKHRILPNVITLPGILVGFVVRLMDAYFFEHIRSPALWWQVFLQSFWGALAGFGLLLFLAWAYEKWKGQAGLGGGDIKLAAMLGAFLGVEGVLWSLWLGSILGLFCSLPLMLTGKMARNSLLPLGSFMV